MVRRILFINAIDPHDPIERQYPQLGLGYLASSLKQVFGEDHFKFRVIYDDVESEISDFRPDIVGISSVTQNYNLAKKYAKLAKKRKIPVIVGGVHITMLPQSLTKDMDVGVLGEGEDTVVELFRIFEKNGNLESDALEEVNGIIFWKEGVVRNTAPRIPITPLDRIPMPDRSILDVSDTTYMFSSRGCPYRCAFCASTRFWNNLRFFSAEYVVNEIKVLVNDYGVKRISFYDDLFIANRARLKEIVAMLKKKKLIGKVSFYCSCRANLVTDEVAGLLKEMNFKSVSMGLETGCDKTLRYLKGESVSIKDNMNAVNILKKHGISVNASFVIGSPKETRKDILKTLDFIKKNRIDSFETYVLTPYPGTPVWEYAKQRGIVSDDMDWDRLNIRFKSNYRNALVVSEKLGKKELYRLLCRFDRWKRYLLVRQALRNPFSPNIPRYVLRKFWSFFYAFTRRIKK